MNFEQLAQAVFTILAPMLPYLLKGVKLAGQKAAEKIGEKSGEVATEQAQRAWKAIAKKKGASAEKVKTAAKQLAKTPQDTDWQAAFINGLTQLFKDDFLFAKELAEVFNLQFGEQVLQAEQNIKTEVEQKMTGPGLQKAVLTNNQGLKVSQTKN